MLIRIINNEVVRFLVAGSINTLLTYLTYLFFLVFLAYQIAYSVAFILGIVLGYTLSTFIVFKEPWTLKKLMQFPAVYLVQYVLGLLAISTLVGYFSFDEQIAPLMVVVLLLPVTYLMSKWIIKT